MARRRYRIHKKTMELVCRYTTVHFARATTPTYAFDMPEYFMNWQPTCSITDEHVLEMAQSFINADCNENMIFYVWGHGYELDAYNKYETLEKLIKMMAEDENIVCVSNSQFYQIFKNEIPSLPEQNIEKK